MGVWGCAAQGTSPIPIGESSEELNHPHHVCPEIAILCSEGYEPKQLANCNQICVPDQGPECITDDDCGAVYCITSPCEQPVCHGGQCVTGAHPEPAGGERCGDKRCGATTYCCNASCGICAPLGGACIQIACSTSN